MSDVEIVWSAAAFRDLEVTHFQLQERERRAARWFRQGVRSAIAQLKEHPESGAVAYDVDDQGRYRHVVFGPFRLFYLFEAGRISVIRIWDARRDPDSLVLEFEYSPEGE